jgi:hypothetical protein
VIALGSSRNESVGGKCELCAVSLSVTFESVYVETIGRELSAGPLELIAALSIFAVLEPRKRRPHHFAMVDEMASEDFGQYLVQDLW